MKLFVLFSTLAFVQASCNNPCSNMLCNNGGFCEDGSCVCTRGFYGSECDKDSLGGVFKGKLVCSNVDTIQHSVEFMRRSTNSGFLVSVNASSLYDVSVWDGNSPSFQFDGNIEYKYLDTFHIGTHEGSFRKDYLYYRLNLDLPTEKSCIGQLQRN